MKADSRDTIERVTSAIAAIQAGRMVIMVDDQDRENEGDLVFAAEHVSAEKINFMAREARGLICLTLSAAHVERLQLPQMHRPIDGSDHGRGTAFTVSIEARRGVTTGISAADRAETVRVAVNPSARPHDLVVPGHIFPLRARPGGVLVRAGHTEGSADLARLAGLQGAAVICEIMRDDGTMARMPDLEEFSRRHQIPIVTIADLIEFRLLHENLVERAARFPIKTSHGTFIGHAFRSVIGGATHLAISNKENFSDSICDVRVHRQRPWIDVFGDEQSGGRSRIQYALRMLATSPAAVIVYLGDETGESEMPDVAELAAPFMSSTRTQADRATGGEEGGGDHSGPDARALGTGSQILRSLGITRLRVHVTAEPKYLKFLSGFGLDVVETVIMKRSVGRDSAPATVTPPRSPAAAAPSAAPRNPVNPVSSDDKPPLAGGALPRITHGPKLEHEPVIGEIRP